MPGVGGKMSAIDGLFLESGSGGIAITAKFEKKMSFLQIERIGTANRQPTMGLDELPCLGLQSHSRHAYAALPMCLGQSAGMVELVDAADSKSAEGNLLRVQVSLPVPNKIKGL